MDKVIAAVPAHDGSVAVLCVDADGIIRRQFIPAEDLNPQMIILYSVAKVLSTQMRNAAALKLGLEVIHD